MTDVEKILDAYGEAQELTKRSAASGSAAVKAAWCCGRLLREQQAKLNHGEWELWVAKNLATIGLRTVQRLLKLAAAKSESLDKATSIRQAYILFGVIPESKQRSRASDFKPGQKVILSKTQKDCLRLALDLAAPEGEYRAAAIKLIESWRKEGISGYDILKTMNQR
jgi:hypothetical protein